MDVTYSATEMGSLSWNMMKKEWSELGPASNFISQFVTDFRGICKLTFLDFYIIAAFALGFTIHRYICTSILFKPLAKYLKLGAKDQVKFPESCIKLFYYGLFFAYEYNLVNIVYPDYRYNPASHWTGSLQDLEIPNHIKYLYLLECGFYFHGIYATIFMDSWKKDSIAMIFHHILANSLIIFSYACRYHRIGLIVLYLHDLADVFLEGTKIVVCIKNKMPSNMLEALSTVGFLSFTTTWFYYRLLVYPKVVLFSAIYIRRIHFPDGPLYFFFNNMLLALFLLNIWWFHLIVCLIFRVATGRSGGVEDTREYDEKAELEKSKKVDSRKIR